MIRKVVEDVFQDEDRGRNLIEFGLEEEAEQLGEKPALHIHQDL